MKTITPVAGYNWKEIEIERTIRSSRQYYLLPEIKAKFEADQKVKINQGKALVQAAKETCKTWEEFKTFVAKHKSSTHLSDATDLYNKTGYIPGLFHLLFLA